MATDAPWDAVVLAGGRGSRMGGVDKGAIEVDGTTLLDRTLAAVGGARTVVVVGDADVPGAVVVQEEPRFAGPAAAIGAGLAEVDAPWVCVVACDQPFLDEALAVLLDAERGPDGVIALDPGGRRQNLTVVARTAALRASVAAQPTLTDLSVRALLAPLVLAEVPVGARAALDVDSWHDRDDAQAEGTRHD